MSATNKAVALNLGMQTVAVASFEILPEGGLKLCAYKETELLVDPAADVTRPDQLKVAVKELREAIKVKKNTSVNQCLPSQAVFTRFVHLPGASPEEVRSVIAFEAQQNVPFPIDEVVWDYQILGAERNKSWDVALVAIKSDQLSQTYDACEAGGLRAARVDVVPMALYNAFRFNYADFDGASLLIDIGARTTNLIFVDGDKLFSRTIPIGGNTISANIAKELSQDISVAEVMKKEKGFIALGGAYAEPEDATVAKMSKVARNTMTRLHAEITRSISFYRANQGGNQPVRTFLCGRGVSMPYMLEFFAEKLQMPVEFFNPLRNVTVADERVAAAIGGRIHAIGELVGLGLRQAGNCPIEIDLRPARATRQMDLARRQPALIAALFCLGLALLGPFLFFQKAGEVVAQVAEGVTADLNHLQRMTAEIQKEQNELQRIEQLAAPLQTAIAERAVWAAIVDSLGAALPARYIWITQMTPVIGETAAAPAAGPAAPAGRGPRGAPRAPGAPPPQDTTSIDAIRIDGLYLENPQMATVVDQFVDHLEKSELFVITPEVRTKMVRSQPDGGSWAYTYSIVVPLRTPIPQQ